MTHIISLLWEEKKVVDNLRFSSTILLFNEEDKGFGKNKPPAGYLELEIREGKGRLFSMVQDLKDSDEYTACKLYFIKYREGEVFYACMGTIPVRNGRGEITRKFDAFNVEGTKFSIDDFNAAAIILEREIGGRIDIKCPLAVCKVKDEKIKWDQVFGKFAVKVKTCFREESSATGREKRNVTGRDDRYAAGMEGRWSASREDRYAAGREESNASDEISAADEIRAAGKIDAPGRINTTGMINTSVVINAENGINETGKAKAFDEEYSKDEISAEYEMGFNRYIKKDEAKGETKSEVKDETKSEAKDEIKDEIKDEVYGNIHTQEGFDEKPGLATGNAAKEKGPGMDEDIMKQRPRPDYEDYEKYDDIYSKFTGTLESKYSFAENMKGVYPGVSCQRCSSKIPDIDLLSSCFDKAFKRCDPFNTKRQDYKWWKVTSPVHLSNILYYCNIHVPKIFSPPVIMAYYKYRYLITGIYTSRKRNKVYIVHGIPGTHNVDESPLGDLCKWVQTEGNTPRYGSFGYWVAYVDPFTGEFLKLSQ